ncbi:hypothetical protein OIU85_004225 [Salix viminalis]|uniref:Uncharacterized protein n=1 Tax=Salix viminalis TaxID=40686 RepID=A0A9Q0PS95_SALVM|nr:hypothetical protein OIU85_004225 [Salix viminalis]
MLTSSSKLPQKSLQLKQHDKKGSSKRVARDVSMANLSTEDYHVGASVAVPFTWESQPGTPKIRKTSLPASPASSSSSSSSSSRLSSSWPATYSVPSSPMKISRSRGGYNGISSRRQYFDDTRKTMPNHDGQEHENKYCDEYPVSTLCFGGNGRGASAKSRGCYASMIKVLLRGA